VNIRGKKKRRKLADEWLHKIMNPLTEKLFSVRFYANVVVNLLSEV